MDKKKLILVDGYSFFFRAYFAIKTMKRKADGFPVNGIYGFTRMLMNLIIDLKSTHIAVIFDTGGKTFRHEIFPNYKANRPPVPEDMKPQFPIIREVVDVLNIKSIEKQGYEADDIIATLSKKAEAEGYEVLIISGDKDLMQLVNDNIFLYDTKESKKIGVEQVREKWGGVEPKQLLDVLSLMGDTADNVPGVPSIGEKTAEDLVKTYGNIDNLIKNVDSIKQEKRKKTIKENIDSLLLSKKLITLCDNIDLNLDIEDLAFKNFDPSVFLDFLYKMEFNSIARDVEKIFFDEKQEKITKKSKVYNYKKITDIETLQNIVNSLIENNNKVIFDIVTENIDDYNNIKTICFLDENKKNIFYICIDNKEAITDDFFAEKEKNDCLCLKNTLNIISPLFENNKISKISYNIKKQIRILKAFNIDIKNYEDIGVMSYLLDNGRFENQFLSTIISYYLYNNVEFKIDNIEKNNFFIQQYEKGKNLKSLEIHDIFEFFCQKIEILNILYKLIYRRLEENEKLKKLYEDIEKPLILVLADMEFEGVKIDINELNNLSDYFEENLKNIEVKIYKEAGLTFNINSPKQLGEILFEKLNYPCGKKSKKSGYYSTDMETLEDLYEKGFEIAGNILEYRHFTKLKNTYSDVLPKLIDKNNRVHTTYSNTYVITGRLSSSNPNLQNIPIRTEDGEKIRKTFIAKSGYSFIGADYSQVELRILAEYANVKKLIENFKNGLDIHTETAKKVFNTNEITPEMRRVAKAINFSIVYGTSSYGLAKRLDTSNFAAKNYMNNYFDMYPEVKDYMEKTKEFAKQNGYIKTMFNRICYIDLNGSKNQQKQFLERLAINAPIQGTGADIIKIAMIRLTERIKYFDAKIILQVHDELLIEVKNEDVEEVSKIVRNVMENIVDFKIPLPVEIKIGKNWAEVH